MKNNIKYFTGSLLMFALIAMGTGCKKNSSDVEVSNPVLSSISFSPSASLPTTAVTITGSKFGTYKSAISVYFGGIAATQIDSVSDGVIIARVPVNAVSGPISVRVWDASVSSSIAFTVLPPPVITAVSVGAGTPGDTITINGTGFGNDISKIALSFNGTHGTVISVGASGTLITAIVPVGFTSGNLSLFVSGYAVSGPIFGYLAPVPAPVYQLDFEGSLNATVGSTGATYIQGSASALTYIKGING
ncbi:MAG TPA: IPT/TIG domain-containing protein, partial [Bacteroidales bacterium]